MGERPVDSATESDFNVVHDMLDAGVVLETVHREVLAVPGTFESAVRHLGDDRNVGVDPDASKVEVTRETHRSTVIARPHRGGQPVLHSVGPRKGFSVVAELLDRDDWS